MPAHNGDTTGSRKRLRIVRKKARFTAEHAVHAEEEDGVAREALQITLARSHLIASH